MFAVTSRHVNNRTMFTFNSANVAALEEQYQLATYKKMPIVAERGEGVWIYASDGERYLDLYGGDGVAGGGGCPSPPVARSIAQKNEKASLFFLSFFFSTAPPTTTGG